MKRVRQIANTFVRHGLGHMVGVAGLDTYISLGKKVFFKTPPEQEISFTTPQRLLAAFEELGPTFIKLGQLLSTRKDLLSREYIEHFEKLQDNVAPLPFEDLDVVFKSEFGKSAKEAFAFIDEEAMASGSIGQVHPARLDSGEDVVVKIRRPGVEHTITADMGILFFLANQIKKISLRENKIFDAVDIVREFERVICNELDFGEEGKNLERFRENFSDFPEVYFPKVHWEYTCSRVLVMERIYGTSIGNLEELKSKNHDLKRIAVNLFNSYLKQLFIDGFFHADPHPGNLIVMDNGVLGIIDCGMVNNMEEYFINAFIDCFVGLFLGDFDLVARGYVNAGTVTENVDMTTFKSDLRTFADRYMNLSLNTVSISAIVEDALDVALRNNMKIPPAMMITSKGIVKVEGTIKKIDPAFEFAKHSKAFAKKLVVKKKFDPKKFIANGLDFMMGVSDLVQVFPKQAAKILSIIEQQKLNMNVKLSGSDDFLNKLDNYSARVSLAFIAAGLGVASSLVIQAKIAPLIYDVSALGLFGYGMAIVLGFWVVWLILKKGD